MTICPYNDDLVMGEIFIRYTEEHFPLLLGREVRLYL